MSTESVLETALRLTTEGGDRRAQYGSPFMEAESLAAAEQALGIQPIPEHMHLRMILFKIYREVKHHKRDNFVDICGYAKCGQDYWEERDDVADTRKAIADSVNRETQVEP